MPGRQLGATHERHAVVGRRLGGFLPAGRRVVVGDRQRRQAPFDRLPEQLGRRIGAVAAGTVGVQVDHMTTLGPSARLPGDLPPAAPGLRAYFPREMRPPCVFP